MAKTPKDISRSDDSGDLSIASERISQGIEVGDDYNPDLESIRDDLVGDPDGASLGHMVGAQLQVTEVETAYQVTSGLPKMPNKHEEAIPRHEESMHADAALAAAIDAGTEQGSPAPEPAGLSAPFVPGGAVLSVADEDLYSRVKPEEGEVA